MTRPDRSDVSAYARWWNAGRLAQLRIALSQCRHPAQVDEVQSEIDYIEQQQAADDRYDREQAAKRRKRKAG